MILTINKNLLFLSKEVVFLLNHVFLLLLRREHKPFWVRNGWVSFLSALLKGISSVAADREEYVHYWATQIFSACHTCCHIALQWIRCSEVLFTSCDSVLLSACVCVFICVFLCVIGTKYGTYDISYCGNKWGLKKFGRCRSDLMWCVNMIQVFLEDSFTTWLNSSQSASFFDTDGEPVL